MSLQITATADGAELRVGASELAVLSVVPGVLASIGGIDDDPAARRLYPDAYGEDEADREFRKYAHGDIERANQWDRQVTARVIERLEQGPATLNLDEVESMARSLGAARLTIAAREGLLGLDELPTPTSPQETAVMFLGIVQDELVELMLENGDFGG